MENCKVYKIGEYNYYNNKDKNSGYHESQLIKTKLAEAYNQTLEDTDLNAISQHDMLTEEVLSCNKLIIVSGMPAKDEIVLIKHFVEHAQKIIFVLTDIDLINPCKQIIQLSDTVLTQAHIEIKSINKPQQYSYIPELFFNKEINPSLSLKSDNVLFAGSIDGREDKFSEYFYDIKTNEVKSKIVLIPKFNKENDYRIEYCEYIKLQKLFKYTLICITETARNVGWLTSRFIEAINSNMLPFIDYEYDKYNHYVSKDSFLRVNNYAELFSRIEFLHQCDIRKSIINEYRSRFVIDNDNFIKIVKEF